MIGIRLADGSFFPVLDSQSAGGRKIIITPARPEKHLVRLGCYAAEREDFADALLVGTITMETQGDELTLEMHPSPDGSGFSATLSDPSSGHYESAQFDPDKARARAEEPQTDTDPDTGVDLSDEDPGDFKSDLLQGLSSQEPDADDESDFPEPEIAGGDQDTGMFLEDESLDGLEFDESLEQELDQIQVDATSPGDQGGEAVMDDLAFPDDLYEDGLEDEEDIDFSQDLEEALAENPLEGQDELSADDDSAIWRTPSELTDDLEADLESEWTDEDSDTPPSQRPFRPLVFLGFLLAALAALLGLSYLVFIGLKGPEYPPLDKVAFSPPAGVVSVSEEPPPGLL